ncbi:lactosylceramide 4-alpha-galactosyltransferase-like [Macrobrachium nipponense]|uniref:lactosylceramide 4-alpha-galactosyltransferase-like n=1 Tax=Macrobrachium nipponense TaxID=159736 RepID=UPI0030C7D4BB
MDPNWDVAIPAVSSTLNHSFHHSIKMLPHEANYGMPAGTPFHVLTPTTILSAPLKDIVDTSTSACAVESVARHHHLRSVIVYVTAPFIDMSHPLIKILTNLDNVLFSLLDLDELFLDSPLRHWYQERRWLINEGHQCIFISDASRAEILRKYGGTYRGYWMP